MVDMMIVGIEINPIRQEVYGAGWQLIRPGDAALVAMTAKGEEHRITCSIEEARALKVGRMLAVPMRTESVEVLDFEALDLSEPEE